VEGIPNDGLIKIANLDVHVAVGVSERSEISQMAVAADPYRGSCGQLAAPILQPLIKLDGASAPFSNYASVAEPPLADWLGYLMKFDYAKIASPKQATS